MQPQQHVLLPGSTIPHHHPLPSCPFYSISSPKSDHNEMDTTSSLLPPQLYQPNWPNHQTSKLWPSCVHSQYSQPLGFEAIALQQVSSVGNAGYKRAQALPRALQRTAQHLAGTGHIWANPGSCHWWAGWTGCWFLRWDAQGTCGLTFAQESEYIRSHRTHHPAEAPCAPHQAHHYLQGRGAKSPLVLPT